MSDMSHMSCMPDESETVWKQLLALAESGDIRAIKLYYEMLEKKQHARQTAAADSDPTAADRDIEQMAAIRRAVFGDAAPR